MGFAELELKLLALSLPVESTDEHTTLACELFNTTEPTKEQRQFAKQVSFTKRHHTDLKGGNENA